QCPRIGGDLGLPAVGFLVPNHRFLALGVPYAGRLASHIVLTNECRLNLPCTILADGALSARARDGRLLARMLRATGRCLMSAGMMRGRAGAGGVLGSCVLLGASGESCSGH